MTILQSFVENALALVVVLGVLIFIHESGHFLMAKWLGFPVEVFSFGFGKRLFGFTRGGTDYRVSAIPLGGYVRVVGLGPDESSIMEEGEDAVVPPVNTPRWKRFLILVMGPLMNLAFAVIVVAVMLMTSGMPEPRFEKEPPVVGWVEAGSAGEKAGVRPGDRVVSIDGEPATSWQEISLLVAVRGLKPVPLVVERGGQPLTLTLTPDRHPENEMGLSGLAPGYRILLLGVETGRPAARAGLAKGDVVLALDGQPVLGDSAFIAKVQQSQGRPMQFGIQRGSERRSVTLAAEMVDGRWRIGVQPGPEVDRRRVGPLDALRGSLEWNWRMTLLTGDVVGNMFKRTMSLKQLQGPLRIAKESGRAAREGMQSMFEIMAMLSLSLGLLNLMPIPLLDGGHIFILLIEGAARRDLPIRVKERILQVGFVFLLLLMSVVIFNDVAQLLKPFLKR